MSRLGALLVGMLMPLAAAHAALITTDSPAGPQTAVLDTNTGLQWLKPSTTANMTFNDVFAAIAPGGEFEGFRYPTYDEFTCGLLGANTGLGCGFHWATFDVAPVWAFFDVFGGRPAGRSYHTVGRPFRNLDEIYGFGAAFYYYDEPRPEFEFDTQQILLSGLRLDMPTTHWLVREAAYIPEPAPLALLGIGAIALAARRGRR